MKPEQKSEQCRARQRAIIIAILVILGSLVAWGTYLRLVRGLGWAHWTGFGDYRTLAGDYQRAKTLWDWLDLLIVPAVLAFGVWWLQKSERATEREIAQERHRQYTLESYLDFVGTLLVEEGLPHDRGDHGVDSPLLEVLSARTLATLRSLDPRGMRQVLEFLYDSALVNTPDQLSMYQYSLGVGQAHKRTDTPRYRDQDTLLDLTGAQLSAANLREAALTTIRLPKSNLAGADLREARLEEANLVGASLRGAVCRGARLALAGLREATLRKADLSGADLRIADLSKADLRDAELRGTRLEGANLQQIRVRRDGLETPELSGASLAHTDLVGVDLRNKTLFGTDFSYAQMSEADLRGAVLAQARFIGTDLSGALLKGAVLRGGNLRGANLKVADLTRADLSPHSASPHLPHEVQRTVLTDADLTGAKLKGADLTGVDLTNTTVTLAQLQQAKSLASATMPDGTIRPGPAEVREMTSQSAPYYAVLDDILDRDVHALDGHPVAGSRSPGSHVYLMENGKKSWIKDIPTLEALGFLWMDVIAVDAGSLRRIPNGPAIPQTSRPAPQPQTAQLVGAGEKGVIQKLLGFVSACRGPKAQR